MEGAAGLTGRATGSESSEPLRTRTCVPSFPSTAYGTIAATWPLEVYSNGEGVPSNKTCVPPTDVATRPSAASCPPARVEGPSRDPYKTTILPGVTAPGWVLAPSTRPELTKRGLLPTCGAAVNTYATVANRRVVMS